MQLTLNIFNVKETKKKFPDIKSSTYWEVGFKIENKT